MIEQFAASRSQSHWELAVDDVQRAKRFYSRVFAWSFEDDVDGTTLVRTPTGLDGEIVPSESDTQPAALNAFFPVDDVATTLRAAVAAGASVLVAKTSIPDHSAFAVFLDPFRIPIAVFERPGGAWSV